MGTAAKQLLVWVVVVVGASSCDRLFAPKAPTGLDVRVTFPESASVARGRATTTDTARAITRLTLIVTTPAADTILTEPFVRKGASWGISVDLDPIERAYVMVEAWHGDGLAYSGADTTVTVRSGDVATAEIAMRSHYPTAGLALTVQDGHPFTVWADARSSCPSQASIGPLQVRFDWENDGTWDTDYRDLTPRAHRFSGPGLYTIVAEVTEVGGLVARASEIIAFEEEQPPLEALLAVVPATGYTSDLFVADVTVLTNDGPAAELRTRWDWNGDGYWDTPWIRETMVAAHLTEPGLYPVTVEVSDDQGRSTTAQQAVSVAAGSLPPAAHLVLSPISAPANHPVVADASASRAIDGAERDLSFRWDWDGDGIWDTEWDGASSRSHEFQSEGRYGIRVEVRDQNGLTSIVEGDVVILAEASKLAAGWQMEVNGVLMAHVPDGSYEMGSDQANATEFPPHRVSVSSFFMDVYEVTNAQYQRFVLATGHPAPPNWAGAHYPPGRADHPVTSVSWHDAGAYAAWRGVRLPAETEWEYAARGSDGRMYPWGKSFNGSLAAHGSMSMVRVGQFPQGVSPFGIHDMAGNASEWTASRFQPYPGFGDYILVSPFSQRSYDDQIYLASGNPFTEENQSGYVVRGGNVGYDYGTNGWELGSTRRQYLDPELRRASTGFRCAVDAP